MDKVRKSQRQWFGEQVDFGDGMAVGLREELRVLEDSAYYGIVSYNREMLKPGGC